jgi:hypothetical protein
MPTAELLRVNRMNGKKKENRIDSLEDHILTLTNLKATEATIQTKIDGLAAVINAIPPGVERDNLNADAAIVEKRASLDIALLDAQSNIQQRRAFITALNDLVQADSDYTVAEKQQYADAKTNEV